MTDTRYAYRFVIDAYTPDTLPMWRLADYMADLARLLGEVEHVHFGHLEIGSTVLVQHIEHEAAPKVQRRLQAVARDDAPEDAAKAFKALNRRLADDNATASLCEDGGAEVIRFPGREQPQPLTFGAFNQTGTLDGQLVRIGGRDDTAWVHLQDRDTVHVCNARRDLARRLARYLYADTLRVHGQGRWERDAEGTWILKRFTITDFDVLDDAPLSDAVERLREVEGSAWTEVDDPHAELEQLRNGPDEVH